MSLLKKLKPDAKARCGKVAECPRCGNPDAEHYSANYIACAPCDSGAVPKYVVDEKTDRHIIRVWYRCKVCSSQQLHAMEAVAKGQGCVACHGPLRLIP